MTDTDALDAARLLYRRCPTTRGNPVERLTYSISLPKRQT